MIKIVTFITLINLFMMTNYAQVNDHNFRDKVLNQAITGKPYHFFNTKDSTVTWLTYLGSLRTATGRTYKVLNSTWIWGRSRHATSRILIYNGQNRYVGHYRLGMTYDLPNRLEGTTLIFLNSDNTHDACDPKQVTRIELRKGLPKEIFIGCQGKSGNVYSFERE